jgi:fructokinase
MERPLVVVAGENLVDRIERRGGAVEEIPGGGPYTTARGLARLGCRVAIITRLSTDPYGSELRRRLDDDGVDLSLAVLTDDPTLVAHASLDGDGAATYRFDAAGSAAAGLRPRDLPEELPPEATALHVGTLGLVLDPMASTIAGLVERTTGKVLVMTDLNIRPAAIEDEPVYRSRLDRVLGRTDVVKASVDDLRWIDRDGAAATDGDRRLPGAADGARWLPAATRLLDRGPAVVLLTDGPGPVRVVMSAAEPEVLDVPEVAVVDTIGAGDAFGAGFLAAWTAAGRGRDVGDAAAVAAAAAFGIRVATWTVTKRGAALPRREDLGER